MKVTLGSVTTAGNPFIGNSMVEIKKEQRHYSEIIPTHQKWPSLSISITTAAQPNNVVKMNALQMPWHQ